MGKKSKHRRSNDKSDPARNRINVEKYNAHEDISILLIDCNNVRGCSPQFTHSLECFLRLVVQWTLYCGLSGRVFCMVDHGRLSSAFILDEAVVVVFAGPGKTADDIICEDANGYSRKHTMDGMIRMGNNVAVITNDRGLKKRLSKPCTNSVNFNKIRVFRSNLFLEMIEQLNSMKKTLRPLDQSLESLKNSENRLREHFLNDQRSLKPQKAIIEPRKEAEEEMPSSFNETTWQRVLLAELLRQCLQCNTKAGYSKQNSISCLVQSDKSEVDSEPKENEREDEPDKQGFTSPQPISELVMDTKLCSHLRMFETQISSTEVNLMNENYLSGHKNSQQFCKCHSLLFDHRIRHDKLSTHNLVDFLKSDLFKVWGWCHPSSIENREGDRGGGGIRVHMTNDDIVDLWFQKNILLVEVD